MRSMGSYSMGHKMTTGRVTGLWLQHTPDVNMRSANALTLGLTLGEGWGDGVNNRGGQLGVGVVGWDPEGPQTGGASGASR